MTYNILVIQENGRHEENRNFRECFCIQRALTKLDHKVDVYGLNHNTSYFNDFNQYDIIINLENYDTGWVPDLSKVTSYKILWSIDAHCRGIDIYKNEYSRGKYNLVLQATPEYVSEIKNSIWFPNCYDDQIIFPMGKKEHFLGFCGNYPTQDRQVFMDNIANFFPLKRDIFVIGEKMVKAISSYYIHINKNMSNDINYRNFETIGCKTLLLTNYNKHYDKLGLIHGENCLIYKDFNECIKLISNIDFNDIEKISQKGFELAKQHTYEARFSKLLNDISI